MDTHLFWNYYSLTSQQCDESKLIQTASNADFEYNANITDYKCCNQSTATINTTENITTILVDTCITGIYATNGNYTTRYHFDFQFTGDVVTITTSDEMIADLYVKKGYLASYEDNHCSGAGYAPTCTLDLGSGVYSIELNMYNIYNNYTNGSICVWDGAEPTNPPTTAPTAHPLPIPEIECGQIVLSDFYVYQVGVCFPSDVGWLEPFCVDNELFWNLFSPNASTNCTTDDSLLYTVSNEQWEYNAYVTDYMCCGDTTDTPIEDHPESTPTVSPTSAPSVSPITAPTLSPTASPDAGSSGKAPVSSPGTSPISNLGTPTNAPSASPTDTPIVLESTISQITELSSNTPTTEPTVEPSVEPTMEPTMEPTAAPTANPTAEIADAANLCSLLLTSFVVCVNLAIVVTLV